MIDTYIRNAIFFNYWLDSTFSMFFYILLFLYFSIPFRTKNLIFISLLPNKTSICKYSTMLLCRYDLLKMFLSNLDLVRGSFELAIILHNLLSISLGIFKGSISELSTRFSKVSLYLLGIVIILIFPSASLMTCLRTCFLRLAIIQSWYWEGVLSQVFPSQALRSYIEQCISI